MIARVAVLRNPASLNLTKLSFVSHTSHVINFSETYDHLSRSFSFGYRDEDEQVISIAAVVLEERTEIALQTRSMIWRIAEIKVERQNEWLVFSRPQDDLSPEALSDFLLDSRNYLEHLRDEHKRSNPE